MLTRRAPVSDASLSDQVASRLSKSAAPVKKPTSRLVSTGSTLLDLAISGGINPEGGIPPGILVEIFGPSGCGKTVILCELAGAVQRQGGDVKFSDPEGRLNSQFAALFGFTVEDADYGRPDTVPELFAPIRKWEPKSPGVNAIFADSLAALSTDMEMKDGDKMGQRRAKEFSEECRKTCRILASRDLLMVCSNQVRQNVGAGPFEQKYIAPGGEAIPFYASLRLRCHSPIKTTRAATIAGKEYKRVVGVQTMIEVHKSSIWEPHQGISGTTCNNTPVHITYDYGIDDIRANLEFVKSQVGGNYYMLNENERLDVGLERSIKRIEEGDGLDLQLKRYVIQLWHEFRREFKVNRAAKRRE